MQATIPLQSLSLLNSEFVVARASAFAARLKRQCAESENPEPRIRLAFVLATGRSPGRRELTAAEEFLRAQPSRYPALPQGAAGAQAWTDLCQMILASNSFLYVD
jgi:hypothetical protein